MGHGMNMFDGTVVHQKPMLGDELEALARGTVDDLAHAVLVVRMRTVNDRLDGGLCRRLVSEYSISAIRPIDISARNVPAEASDLTQLFRGGQINPAPPQRLLGFLAFGSFPSFAQRALHRWYEPR